MPDCQSADSRFGAFNPAWLSLQVWYRGSVWRGFRERSDRCHTSALRLAALIEEAAVIVAPAAGAASNNDGGGKEKAAPNHLTQLVRDYIDAADIGKRGSCHLLRHTSATLMLEGGADIRFIQQLLGHAELSTTQNYTQVSIQQLKQVHTACHLAEIEPPVRGKGDKP